MRETGQQANRNLGKCPKCGKSTPLRSGSCLYCGAFLDDVRPIAQASNEKLVEEPRQLGAGSARHQKVYDGRGHYLFLGAREPIVLEPNKLFLIGRDTHASLVVHSLEISRQHCEIDWRGEPPRPVLLEVRARNGTYVNDRPLRRGEPEPLRDRDVIRLGRDFEAVYRQLDERELKETLGESGRADTRAIRLPQPGQAAAPAAVPVPVPVPAAIPAAAVAAPAASILPETGDMTQIPGGLLLETYHRERRTGKLTVFDGQTAGEVVLVDGRAKVAVFGGLQNRDALEAIARTARGVYRFVPDAPVPMAAPPAPNPLAAMALGMGVPAAGAPAGIPPELFALYQAQLTAAAPPPVRPVESAARPLPPELASLFAAAAVNAVAAAQQYAQPSAPLGPPPPSPLPQPRPAPQTSSGHVPPIRGASEPTPSQIAAILNEARPGPPTPATPPPPGTKTAARARSDVLPIQGAPPVGPRPGDPLKPTTQQQPARPQPNPLKQTGQRPAATSSRGKIQAAEPLKAPTDPYVTKPSGGPAPATAGYAPPSAPANGDSPEAREANAMLSTVRAVGLAGEQLGNFVGDTMAKLLDDGKLAIAIELGERGLALADKGSFEAGLATRVAFKTCMKNPLIVARAVELIEKGLAGPHGNLWAPKAAQRFLQLVDPEVPPDPRDSSVLGRLAAIARK